MKVYALCQYEREHFICLETAILEAVQVKTSLTDICYVVHRLKNPAHATFFFLSSRAYSKKVNRFDRQFGVSFYIGAPRVYTERHAATTRRTRDHAAAVK